MKILLIPLFLILVECSSIPKKISDTSSSKSGACPDFTGTFQCPAMQNVKYPQPAYTMYAVTEKNIVGTYIYKSYLSISPERKSEIISDGKKRSSIDHRGITRNYIASCNKGVLTNKYSTVGKRTAETKIWMDNNGHLNILYGFAKGKVLVCNRLSSTPSYTAPV